MRFFNWAKAFEERRTYEDVLGKVRTTELSYWIGLLISIGMSFAGLAIFFGAPEGNIKVQLLGLAIAIEGTIWWAVIKIVTHVRLIFFGILWDSRNRYKDEMNKISSTDL